MLSHIHSHSPSQVHCGNIPTLTPIVHLLWACPCLYVHEEILPLCEYAIVFQSFLADLSIHYFKSRYSFLSRLSKIPHTRLAPLVEIGEQCFLATSLGIALKVGLLCYGESRNLMREIDADITYPEGPKPDLRSNRQTNLQELRTARDQKGTSKAKRKSLYTSSTPHLQ